MEPSAAEQSTAEQTLAACEQLAQSLCARRTECDTPSLGLGRRFASEDVCRDAYRSACAVWAKASDSGLSAQRVSGCAIEIEGADCRSIAATLYSSVSSMPWCLVGLGVRAEGESCSVDSECRSAICSGRTGTQVCGRCVAPPAWLSSTVYEGEACDLARPCASFLRCEESACRAVACAAPEPGCQDFGAACGGVGSPARSCALGSECKNMNDLGAGQCLPYAAAGERCDTFAGPPCPFPASCLGGICAPLETGACP